MRIGVYGAGAVGGYVGVRLAAAGHDVTLLGRPWLKELGSLEAQDLDHDPVSAHPKVVHDVDALRGCEVVLVTVKSRHSLIAGQDLAGLEAPIVSLQNGLHNATRVAEAAGRAVTPGMVPFNVIVQGKRFRKASSMPLQLQDDAVGQALARAWRAAGEEAQLVKDMRAVQAGKLLFNLGNGLCAATGLRIQQMLRDRNARRVLARCMAEGVAAFRANRLPVERLGPLPGWAVARLLPLPDAIVLTVARSIIQIDAAAMSSTLQDLHAGKPTEIDDLNGEIVRLAPDHSPVNRRIVEVVKRLEGRPLDFVEPAELLG
jgi:2-dehydropantoate 2-reductase